MAQQWILQGLLSTDRRLVDLDDEAIAGMCVHASPLDGSACGICAEEWFKAMAAGQNLNVTVVPPSREELEARLNREVVEHVEPEDTLPADTGDPTIGAPGHVDEEDIAARTVAEDDPVNTNPGPSPEEHVDK